MGYGQKGTRDKRSDEESTKAFLVSAAPHIPDSPLCPLLRSSRRAAGASAWLHGPLIAEGSEIALGPIELFDEMRYECKCLAQRAPIG